MKTIKLISGLLFVIGIVANVDAAPAMVGNQFVVTVSSSSTPAALTNNTSLRAKAITIKARKDRATANTGVIYVGWQSTNDTQLYAVASDAEIVITPPEGSSGYLRLSDIYIDVATNNDGAVVTWFNTD